MNHPAMKDGSFEHLRLGRLPARRDPRTLQFERYVTAQLPAPPASVSPPAVPTWPMYDNDRLGDCTCAAAGHMVQAWTQAAGRERTPALASVDRLYWETGDPPAKTGQAGGPTDTGRVEIDVLNYWRHHGLGTDRILGYVSIQPADEAHVRAAIWLFGGVYTGIGLPITAQRQSVWDYVGGPGSDPGSWGGHAVPYVGYDPSGVTLVTWGALLDATWSFHQHYTEEVYAIVTRDLLNSATQKSPQGLDLTSLEADLAAL